MNEVKEHIEKLMLRLDFPEDAQQQLLTAFEQITNGCERDAFSALLAQYDADLHCDYKEMLKQAEKLAERSEIHPYTVSLLLFLCLSGKRKNTPISAMLCE